MFYLFYLTYNTKHAIWGRSANACCWNKEEKEENIFLYTHTYDLRVSEKSSEIWFTCFDINLTGKRKRDVVVLNESYLRINDEGKIFSQSQDDDGKIRF
jgi:hypothetical protein